MKRIQVKLTYTIHAPDDFDIELLTHSVGLAAEGLWAVAGPLQGISIETPVYHNITVLKKPAAAPRQKPKKKAAA